MLPVLIGCAALTVDVGVIFNARADLQNAADAGALSAAGHLREHFYDERVIEMARESAVRIVGENSVLRRQAKADPSRDVVFGRAVYDQYLNSFEFVPTEVRPDAVRVTVRHTKDSPNGALPLYFASIFGKRATHVSATAVAALVGARDIAVTIDLSGSMKHDSYLRFYNVTQINARDMWVSLGGSPPSRPYKPGAEHETEYAFMSGPSFGIMDTWGDPIDPAVYDPTTDPGLWYIPRDTPINIAAIEQGLIDRGYSESQRTVILGDGSDWTNRVSVMLGLAEWQPNGNNDSYVSDGELSWVLYPPYRKDWVWKDYVVWAGESRNKLTRVHPQFQYRFGVKTFVDFLLDQKDNFSQTDLTATPEQPVTAVKDGVQALVDMSSHFDRMSLEVFGSTGRHEMDLTDDRQAVANRLYNMQANHYDNSTNMGEGLMRAIESLTGDLAREDAAKVIVLMSDGVSKRGPDPVEIARSAAEQGITIYTISVGYGADRGQLQAIAEAGNGAEFYAAGSPEEYAAELRFIFATIGGLRDIALVE